MNLKSTLSLFLITALLQPVFAAGVVDTGCVG